MDFEGFASSSHYLLVLAVHWFHFQLMIYSYFLNLSHRMLNEKQAKTRKNSGYFASLLLALGVEIRR